MMKYLLHPQRNKWMQRNSVRRGISIYTQIRLLPKIQLKPIWPWNTWPFGIEELMLHLREYRNSCFAGILLYKRLKRMEKPFIPHDWQNNQGRIHRVTGHRLLQQLKPQVDLFFCIRKFSKIPRQIISYIAFRPDTSGKRTSPLFARIASALCHTSCGS